MLNSNAVMYLGSRVIAAAGNLLAVAIFSQIAGPAEYGRYVLIFAWSMIVYGFGSQWMRFAYFGVHQTGRIDEYAASLVRLLGAALTLLAVGLAIIVAITPLDPLFLMSVFALVCGMTVYEAAFEVTRTRMKAGTASLSMILRTGLIILFGSLALWFTGSAAALALALALAHLLAAIPCLALFSKAGWSLAGRRATRDILIYGWPLLLSFGVNAVGQSIDRLILGHIGGYAALGSYGVLADLLRQSFTVIGEAIVFTFITVAKQHSEQNNVVECDRVLRKAFNACLATAAFGAAFFLAFGPFVVKLLFGRAFASALPDVIPPLAVAFAFITMRNFYFAQVIYFTQASYLELCVSTLFVVVSSALAVLLVPGHGAEGAALSLMTASIVSCIAFMIAGRRFFRLPIDAAGALAIPLMAGSFLLITYLVRQFAGDPAVSLPLVVAYVLMVGFAVYHFGLLGTLDKPGGSFLGLGPQSAFPDTQGSLAASRWLKTK